MYGEGCKLLDSSFADVSLTTIVADPIHLVGYIRIPGA